MHQRRDLLQCLIFQKKKKKFWRHASVMWPSSTYLQILHHVFECRNYFCWNWNKSFCAFLRLQPWFFFIFFLTLCLLALQSRPFPDSQLCTKLFSLWGLLLLGPFPQKYSRPLSLKPVFIAFWFFFIFFFFLWGGVGDVLHFNILFWRFCLQQNSDHMLPWLM